MERALRVLVVDDEADLRDLLGQGLRRRGYEVALAVDGEVGARALATAAFDALITDLRMPRHDGIRLLEGLRGNHPTMLRIVATSFADKDNVVRALNAGADHLIEKPFTVDAIDRLIRDLARLQPPAADLALDALPSRILEQRMRELGLNDRQRELVVWLLKGLPNKRIAELRRTSEQVAKNAVNKLFEALGIGSRMELVHLVFPI